MIYWCLYIFMLISISSYADEKKTLVIILAETREHQITYENFNKNVLQPLHADLAVCIGVRDSYVYENPFYQNATYRFCYPEPEDYGIAFEEAYQTILAENPSISNPFYWRHFLKLKDQFLGGIKDKFNEHKGSGAILIFYRWFLLHNILQNDVLNKYDFFVITRSDFIYTLPHPSMHLLSENHIYIPNGEGYGGITDRHVILPKKFLISYLDILNKMVTHGNEYYTKMRSHKNWNLEQFIKFHLLESSVWNQVQFFPYIMYSVRSEEGTTRWSTGTYSSKHGYYIKYLSEYKLALHNRLLFEKERRSLDDFYKAHIK